MLDGYPPGTRLDVPRERHLDRIVNASLERGIPVKPTPGTITDPSLDHLWRNEDAQFAPAPERVGVNLSQAEAAWLLEAALKHARKHGQPTFVTPLIEKLWGAYTA